MNSRPHPSYYGREYRGFRIIGNMISGFWLKANMRDGGDFVLRIAQVNSGRLIGEDERLKEFPAWEVPDWTVEEIKWWIDEVWEYFHFPLPHDGAEE